MQSKKTTYQTEKKPLAETPNALPSAEENMIEDLYEGLEESNSKIQDLWANLDSKLKFHKWVDGQVYKMEIPIDLPKNTKFFDDKFSEQSIPWLKVKIGNEIGIMEYQWLKITAKRLRTLLLANKGKVVNIKRTGKGLETKYELT